MAVFAHRQTSAICAWPAASRQASARTHPSRGPFGRSGCNRRPACRWRAGRGAGHLASALASRARVRSRRTWGNRPVNSAAVHTTPKCRRHERIVPRSRFSAAEIEDCVAREARGPPSQARIRLAGNWRPCWRERRRTVTQRPDGFGPRARRPIDHADARSTKMQSVLNLKIKFRESFRPFAPSVLREHVAEWFGSTATALTCCSSPCSAIVDWRRPKACARSGASKLNVPRSTVPAITHVDYSAHPDGAAGHQRHLSRDHRGLLPANRLPGVVNTSFSTFVASRLCAHPTTLCAASAARMDALVLENYILERRHQPPMPVDDSWRSIRA